MKKSVKQVVKNDENVYKKENVSKKNNKMMKMCVKQMKMSKK